jgi:PERQ amino acid-rich with GYF domain-containing protein
MSSANQPSDPSASSQAPPRYVPPHRNGTLADTRYSKDQLLDLYKAQQSVDGGLRDGLENLYVSGWQPDTSNGSASAGWSRGDSSRDVQPGADVCWDRAGTVEPLGLTEMDEEEREVSSARG